MSWESIGSTSTGQMPQGEAWILLSLGLSKKYIELMCGTPPDGSELDVMWHEHELGNYPSLGIWSDYDTPWDYVNACERALKVFDEAVSWHELKEHYEKQASAEDDNDDEDNNDNEENIGEELIKLAGMLSSRPIDADNHKLDELLAGLDAERSRLGQRRFAVVLYQQVYDYEGLTDFVFLIDSFDTQSEAISCVDFLTPNLLAMQTAQPDSQNLRWVLESEGDMWSLPNPTGKHMLRTVHDRTYKLRAGPYDTKYNCFRAIGPFDDFVVSEQLFEFVNSKFELMSYFDKVGEAVRAGKPMSAPQ